MGLSNNLNTNEVKNHSGTEVEFFHREQNGMSHEWVVGSETPYLEHRLVVSHREVGTGLRRVRQSRILIRKDSVSDVDSSLIVRSKCSLILESPVGAISSMTLPSDVLAEVGSFAFTLGTTTFLYDGTGTGAAAQLGGVI